MRWRAINVLLAPVFTLALVCSMARIEITTPRLASKLASQCPFHPGMTVETGQPEVGISALGGKNCYTCLTQSMLTERLQLAHAGSEMPALPVLAAHDLLLVMADEPAAATAAFPFGSGPPPSRVLPLRI